MDDSTQPITTNENPSSHSRITPNSTNAEPTQTQPNAAENVTVVFHGEVLRVPYAVRRPNANRRRRRPHSVGAIPIRIRHRTNPYVRQREQNPDTAQRGRIFRRFSANTRRNLSLERTPIDEMAVDPENYMFQPMCNGDQMDVIPFHPPNPVEITDNAGNTPAIARTPERFNWEDREETTRNDMAQIEVSMVLMANTPDLIAPHRTPETTTSPIPSEIAVTAREM